MIFLTLASLAAGVVSSLIFMLRAGGQNQPLLLILFTGWVLLPYLVMGAIAMTASKSSEKLQRRILASSLLLGAGSFIAYSTNASRPFARPAAAFLMVPAAALIAIGLGVVLLRSRATTND